MSRALCSALIGFGLAAVSTGCMMPMYKMPHGFSSTYRKHLYGGDPRGKVVWRDPQAQKQLVPGNILPPAGGQRQSAADGDMPEIPIPPNAPVSPNPPSIVPPNPGVSQPESVPNSDAPPVQGSRPTARGEQFQQSSLAVPTAEEDFDAELTSEAYGDMPDGDGVEGDNSSRGFQSAEPKPDVITPIIWSNAPVMIVP